MTPTPRMGRSSIRSGSHSVSFVTTSSSEYSPCQTFPIPPHEREGLLRHNALENLIRLNPAAQSADQRTGRGTADARDVLSAALNGTQHPGMPSKCQETAAEYEVKSHGLAYNEVDAQGVADLYSRRGVGRWSRHPCAAGGRTTRARPHGPLPVRLGPVGVCGGTARPTQPNRSAWVSPGHGVLLLEPH